MLTRYKADLHIHTCLSPCGDLNMSPKKIVAEVLRQHTDIIAICDHNSAENVSAVMKVAAGTGVAVLAGMEVCSKEEIHVLAIFDSVTPALALQARVHENLHGINNPDVFGMQVLANELDEVEGFEERLLIGATDLSVDEVVKAIHELQGLAVAAHIDRESFSVISQLGFIPESLEFDALEISANMNDGKANAIFSEYRRYPFVRNSDAHVLNDLGKQATCFCLEEPTLPEIAMALRLQEGRSILVDAQGTDT